MPTIKSIEARLPVADVARSVEFFAAALGFAVGTIWPERGPVFAILRRDGLRVQLRKQRESILALRLEHLWLDVEDLAGLHSFAGFIPESRSTPPSSGGRRCTRTVVESEDR